MRDFIYHNPVKVVFGRGGVAKLAELVPATARVLMVYGGGSIRANGVYYQVREALRRHEVHELGGLGPNPRLEFLMAGVEQARANRLDFLLAVGGGSVIDGVKLMAAAIPTPGQDPWEYVTRQTPVTQALPLGCVVTLPATGSEMNSRAVISREATREKRSFMSPLLYPQFAVMDPETTYSLPGRQVANGIVDAFVHVLEQYLTQDVNAPLQARQAEAILRTLIEEGPATLRHPTNYETRANVMWCATNALNGLIACGVPEDWASHQIGHELTALYGLDHARSVALALRGLLAVEKPRKEARLAQFGRRVWDVSPLLTTAAAAEAAVSQTLAFFTSLGMALTLGENGIPFQACELVAARLKQRNARLGEYHDMGGDEAREILRHCI